MTFYARKLNLSNMCNIRVWKTWDNKTMIHKLCYVQLLWVCFLSLRVSQVLWLFSFLVRWYVKGAAPARTDHWVCMKRRRERILCFSPRPEPAVTLLSIPHDLGQKNLQLILCPCLRKLLVMYLSYFHTSSSKSHETDISWLGYHTTQKS